MESERNLHSERPVHAVISSQRETDRKGEANLLDYIEVLVKWRRFIVLSTFLVGLITAGITLSLPKPFEATAVILPPSEAQPAGLSSLLTGLPLGFLGADMTSEEVSRFLALDDE